MTEIHYSLDKLQGIIRKQKASKVVMVTSVTLKKKLDWALKDISKIYKRVEFVFIPDGEKAKDWKAIEILLKKFIQLSLDRKSIVIALGGGTIGDSVGFACSIYLRGINYINIPTTLLSQIDSAHGGKTGINFLNYKNQIGSFHNPVAIIVDERFIRTLNKDQVIDGLGEIIKAGFIRDKSILKLLGSQTIDSLSKSGILKEIIKRAVNVKQFYIKKDFKDQNIRQILNVGHTIGHALELKYKISHGKAVLHGMLQEAEISEKLSLSPLTVKKELTDLLEKLGINLEKNLKPDWKTILHDKKIQGNEIMWPYISKVGESKLISIKLLDLQSFLAIKI